MQLTQESFIHFPIPTKTLTGISNANWGPQDQSLPSKYNSQPLEIFKSQIMSGYLIVLHRLLHWTTKRQSIMV